MGSETDVQRWRGHEGQQMTAKELREYHAAPKGTKAADLPRHSPELVEKLAGTIYEANIGQEHEWWSELKEHDRGFYRTMACAVLETFIVTEWPSRPRKPRRRGLSYVMNEDEHDR